VTGFGYEHDEAWATNMHLFKHFTDVSQGVRRLGSAAIDMCHVATGARCSAFPPCRRRPDALPAGPGNRPRSQLCVAIQPGAQLAK
jgi:myo-inositol-1(or 4)-monophosphatase